MSLDREVSLKEQIDFIENFLQSGVSNLKEISNLDEEICLELVKRNWFYIKYVPSEKMTEEICLEAVKQNVSAIEYIPKENQTEKVCLEIIKNAGGFIEKIKNKTPKICLCAFLNNFNLLQEEYIQKGIDDFINKEDKLNNVVFCYIDLKYMFGNPGSRYYNLNHNYKEQVSIALNLFDGQKNTVINLDIKSLEYLSDYLINENSGNHFILNDKDDIQLLQKIAKSNNELIIIDNGNITDIHKKIADKII